VDEPQPLHTGVGVVFPNAANPGARLVKSFAETTRVTFAALEVRRAAVTQVTTHVAIDPVTQ
jgi:hypothetical protein